MRYIKNKSVFIIIILYIFITIFLITNNAYVYTNIINPIFWGCTLVYLIWNIKKYYIRFDRNIKYFRCIVIISCIHILIYFYLGFVFGFSKSPYSHSIIEIFKNLIIELIPIIGIEITRFVIATRNKGNKFVVIGITIALILTEIKYNTLISIYGNKQVLFEYFSGTIIPQIAFNTIYTYLTLKGSYILTLTLRIPSKLIILLLPILTATDWFITGSFDLITSIIIYLIFKYRFKKEKEDIRKKSENLFTKISYGLTLAFCITLVCFMLGLFKYKAITILSNSMNPIFSRSDVVIYKSLDEAEIKEIPENTIVIYSIADQNVAHRIVDIIKEDDKISYKTKGDNNNTYDMNLVETKQIKGVYMFRIKYLGLPSIWLYEFLNNDKAIIETK